MQYKIEDTAMLIEVERTAILDIAVGDMLSLKGAVDIEYQWTDRDDQFVENNPDGVLYIKLTKTGDGYRPEGVMIMPMEYHK